MIGLKQGQRTALIGRAHRQNMMHWHERASICIGGFRSIQNDLRNIHGRPLPGYDFWTHSQRTALIGRTHSQRTAFIGRTHRQRTALIGRTHKQRTALIGRTHRQNSIDW